MQAYCTLRNETKWNEICTLRNKNLYFAKWKSVLCEMEICTLRNEMCALRNENLYFENWKSVLCEMKSVPLKNENLYLAKWNLYFAKWNLYIVKWNVSFVKWKSVLCKKKIWRSLRNGTRYFPEKLLWRSFCERNSVLSWKTFAKKLLRTFYSPTNHDRDTRFAFRTTSSRYIFYFCFVCVTIT